MKKCQVAAAVLEKLHIEFKGHSAQNYSMELFEIGIQKGRQLSNPFCVRKE